TAPELAFAITEARRRGVPLKFTAGLHQPLRHADPLLKIPVHGFLNLFVAGAVAYAHEISQDAAEKIIEIERRDRFEFDEMGLHWNKMPVPVSQIEMSRRTLVTSFGSCSFDEPCDGLRSLGLIA